MSQLPLFVQASETVVVDDARGRIGYTPDFVPVEVARVWRGPQRQQRDRMSYETQLHYTHGVPKTNEPVGPRISLAFRVRPAAD
jgi:hypothetical protein